MTTETEKKWEPNPKSHIFSGQILSGLLVGAIFGIAGTVFLYGQRITALEEYVSMLKQRNVQAATQSMQPAAPPALPDVAQSLRDISASERDDVRPEKLADFIKEQQKLHVKPSYGEYASQAFTDEDLKQFVKDGVPGQIAQDLRHDNLFISVVFALKQLPPAQRQALLRSCDRPLHPTWAELGRVTPDGQTDAGRRAEILVADAIVSLVKDLLHLSPDELKALYS